MDIVKLLRKLIQCPPETPQLLMDISIRFNTEELTPELFNDVLKMLGEYTDVSRVYIFEDSLDGRYTTNTYEWVNKGVKPQIQNLKDYPYARIPSHRRRVYEEGMLLSYDVTELEEDLRQEFESEGILSILVLPITGARGSIGFIGFDETRKKRIWTGEEIRILKIIASIVGIALDRYHFNQKLKETNAQLKRMNEMIVKGA